MITLPNADYVNLLEKAANLDLLIAACKRVLPDGVFATAHTYEDADNGTTHRTCCHAIIYNGDEPHASDCDTMHLASVLAGIEKTL